MTSTVQHSTEHSLRKTARFVGCLGLLLTSTLFLIVFTIVFHVLLAPFRLAAFLVRKPPIRVVRHARVPTAETAEHTEKGKRQKAKGEGLEAVCRVPLLNVPLRFLFVSGPCRIVLVLLAILALCVGAPAFLLNRPTGLADPQKIVIQRGMTVRQIGQRLRDRGLIRSVRFFALMAKLSGIEGRLEAGEYRLNGRKTTYQTMLRLTHSEAITKNVTIPEGRILREIAGILRREVAIDSVRFVNLASDSAFCRQLGVQAPTLEGYLFPDTYNLFYRMDERTIIETITAHFWEVFSDSLRQRAQDLGLTVHQAVILASIVETEAQKREERPIIASIFHRRLRLGRALESCATVQYALGRHKPRLLDHDLKVDSPYNTYLHPGLPPGPIANPGRAALAATLYPADVDYLYFVSRGDGTHIFTRSLRDHINAKRRIKIQQRANAANRR